MKHRDRVAHDNLSEGALLIQKQFSCHEDARMWSSVFHGEFWKNHQVSVSLVHTSVIMPLVSNNVVCSGDETGFGKKRK